MSRRRPDVVRIVTFSTLFPNAAQPAHGVFVENRLRHLVHDGRVSARVVAPVPWFPSSSAVFGDYARFAAAPRHECRHGITIEHPRYPVIPKLGMTIAPFLLYRAARPVLRRLLQQGGADLIDAHYFYPDGVAAALLARHFGLPFTVTARGTDLNLIPKHRLARRQILWAAAQASHVITVCQALKDLSIDLGFEAARVSVLRNGVDLEAFRPHDRGAARAKLGLERPTLLSVGHLIERKGHDIVIEALATLPDFDLLIVGSGPLAKHLEALAKTYSVASRVRFLGAVPHAALAEIYSAADALALASSREGWPNVLLEAMACGTPVVASMVYGTPEVVTTPAAGVMFNPRTPQSFAAAVRTLFENPPHRDDTRAHAEQFNWDATTRGQLALFQSIIQAG